MTEAIEAPATINLLDPWLYSGDPYPTYAWLREHAPVYWDAANRIWGISRHQDIIDVERNTARYTSSEGSRPHIEHRESMINRDDPRHMQQRRLVYSRFTPRAVRSHDERIRAHVTRLLDQVEAKGSAEVVRDLAAPLPAMVICEMLGFDLSRWDDCRRWSEVTMANAGYLPGDERAPGGSEEAIMEFAFATMEVMAARRKEPKDDLISAWVQAELDGAPLPDEEIIQEALLLLDGGAETTRSVIGQTVLSLIEHPEQRRLLIDKPEVIGQTAVEEFIRWVSPILNMRRTATEDHELHGEKIKAGDQLLLIYPSGNRDPAVFDDPDRFDVTRSPNHHLAFGIGTHFCLGANLARIEIRIMFEELLRRFPDYRLADGAEPELVPGYFTRTLDSLPIVLG